MTGDFVWGFFVLGNFFREDSCGWIFSGGILSWNHKIYIEKKNIDRTRNYLNINGCKTNIKLVVLP